MKSLAALFLIGSSLAAAPARLKVRMSWGHNAPQATPYTIKLVPATAGVVAILNAAGRSLEAGEVVRDGVWHGTAGAGDVDALEFTLAWQQEHPKRLQNTHVIW